MTHSAGRLRGIKTFGELVRYLEEELDWPVEEYSFDELTFEYTPAEVGLKDADAAKVRAIHQLRPLQHGQPWGIFFVEFENKRMPVVVLRRILSHLVLKKRASARQARAAAWDLDDLLFISAFGDEASDRREIAFAHFHQETGDLPTLRVLGWDGADTPLKLEHVAATLKGRLRWPDDPTNAEAWREQWSPAFRHRLGHVIRTADALAERLALLARGIRDAAITLMEHESERGSLRRLHQAFQTALIHDLSEADFADTYAQTVTYGLLTAAISRTDMDGGRYGTALLAQNVADMVPITNPFLREMLQTFLRAGGRQGGIDFDELGIQDVVDLLRGDETDLPAILRDFGNKAPGQDPVIHFYEHFLSAYDKQLKVQRGVFYTPQPVVSYIVRSVHELLQSEFGIQDGLASTITWGEMAARHPELQIPEGTDPQSPFVVVLDPATGTATFFVEVIDVVHRTLMAKWQGQGLSAAQQRAAWNEYVPKHLLPRLYGYELMMAPYAIAHMKVGLKLHETGYRFGSDERVRVYLTNALEPASDGARQLSFDLDAAALAHEAQAVNAVKRHQRFTVVVGNPPYSKSSQNQGRWIEEIMEEYKRTVRTAETQIQALSDDYSKFLRLGHFTLEQSQIGILSFITNNGYLDGPLFRDMRSSMLSFFGDIRILNLHGDSRKQFSPPEGKADVNVFDIQQGVAVTVLWRKQMPQPQRTVEYGELWGTREERYGILQASSVNLGMFERVQPAPPFFLFIPVAKGLEAEFDTGWHLYDVFGTGNREVDNHESYGAGFVTQQDEFAIGFSDEELAENVREFLDPKASDEALWNRFKFCSTNQWSFDRAKKELRGLDVRQLTKRCLYRPFDYRFTVFDRNICTILRKRITHQFGGANIGLLATRRVTRLPFNNIFVTDRYAEYKVVSHDRNTIVFPLWIRAEDENDARWLFGNKQRLNLSPQFLGSVAKRLGLAQHDRASVPCSLTPEGIFHYVYAVFHSPTYRTRYAEFLKIDFPRLPLTSSLELFRALARLGGELGALHLMESPALDRHLTTYTGPADPQVEKVSYARETVWLDKVRTRGFRGVPEAVWNFRIGGYQVCEKWLKDRGPKKGKPGRTLTPEDIEHYHRIVVALQETIRLMGEIDEVIEAHGGWPIE